MSVNTYPYPAVGVFIFHDNGLYLIKKKRSIFEGQWCTPGGKIEYGEEILETVRREVKEETNLDISDIEFITYEQTIERNDDGSVNRHFVFFNFKAKIDPDSCSSPRASDDAAEVVLVPMDKLCELNLSAPTIRTLSLLGKL